MSTSARRLWIALWVALAALLVVRATIRPDDRTVLLDSLEFGRRLLHGEDVYAGWHSGRDAPERPLHAPYPPSFGLLMAPFAVVHQTLGLRPARALWALLQVGALLAFGLAFARLPTGRAPPSPLASRVVLLLTLLVGARFVLRDAHGGGGNLVNLGLCALAFLAAERQRPWVAGLLLGFSLATKPTQAWLLPVLWLLGHRRAAAGAVLTAAAAALLSLLLLRLDAGPWLRWAQGSWAIATQADAYAPPALGFPEFEWMNQSLRGAVARWFGSVPDQFAAKVRLGLWPGAGLGLTGTTVAWIQRGTGLVGLLAVLVAATRARSAAWPAARTHAFAAAMVLSLLLSPLSWKAHHVALLPAVLLLLRAVHEGRRPAAALLLAAFVPVCLAGRDVIGDDADEWLNASYVVTAFDLLLLAFAVHGAVVRPAPPRSPSP